MGLAVVDKLACVSWKGDVLCRTCYNVCPFPNAAIRLDDFRPVIDETRCTGCGLCVHGCPVTRSDGFRAINIEPIYSFRITSYNVCYTKLLRAHTTPTSPQPRGPSTQQARV